jgi:hypothetical protein
MVRRSAGTSMWWHDNRQSLGMELGGVYGVKCNLCGFPGRQPPLSRSDISIQLVELGRAGNNTTDYRLRGQPSDRKIEHRMAAVLRIRL